MDLKQLYQDIILEHGKSPRNLGKCKGYSHEAKGYNPLCGDRVHVYLKLDTAKNFREVTIGRLCTRIFQQRLNSILLDKKSSLLSAYIGTYNLTLNNEFYYIGAQLKEDEIKEGINILFTEIERVKQNGFIPKELEIEKEKEIMTV